MCFKRKTRREKILGKKVISVDEAIYLMKTEPRIIATAYNPLTNRLKEAKIWFDEEPLNEYKRRVLRLAIGDKILNAAGAEWVVNDITPYEIIFYDLNSGKVASRVTKWDFYKMLKMNFPVRFL